MTVIFTGIYIICIQGPDGKLIIVSMKDNKLLKQQDDGSLVEFADMSSLHPNQSNDMVVDDKVFFFFVYVFEAVFVLLTTPNDKKMRGRGG